MAWYEINVARKLEKLDWQNRPQYIHFFATAKRSISNKPDLRIVLTEMKRAFPEPDFKISVSYNCVTGQHLDDEEINKILS